MYTATSLELQDTRARTGRFWYVDKKQKVDLDEEQGEECEPSNIMMYMQDMVSDIALKIGLREPLLETAKLCIAWALLLNESLTNGMCTYPPSHS
ncbi:hypothetical protein B0H10DRAFT_2043528 [Mycena sp. CBHHK59/15]|nr:hypothetical protein B0H10DRAFT_2043528 [Mycena sp. CBHHK59/15]